MSVSNPKCEGEHLTLNSLKKVLMRIFDGKWSKGRGGKNVALRCMN
jgi:hypothetical protein